MYELFITFKIHNVNHNVTSYAEGALLDDSAILLGGVEAKKAKYVSGQSYASAFETLF